MSVLLQGPKSLHWCHNLPRCRCASSAASRGHCGPSRMPSALLSHGYYSRLSRLSRVKKIVAVPWLSSFIIIIIFFFTSMIFLFLLLSVMFWHFRVDLNVAHVICISLRLLPYCKMQQWKLILECTGIKIPVLVSSCGYLTAPVNNVDAKALLPPWG